MTWAAEGWGDCLTGRDIPNTQHKAWHIVPVQYLKEWMNLLSTGQSGRKKNKQKKQKWKTFKWQYPDTTWAKGRVTGRPLASLFQVDGYYSPVYDAEKLETIYSINMGIGELNVGYLAGQRKWASSLCIDMGRPQKDCWRKKASRRACT